MAGLSKGNFSPVDAARATPNFECQLLNALGDAVIATDLNGSIVFWNLAAERLYGWRASDVEGRNILDVTPSSQSRAAARSGHDGASARPPIFASEKAYSGERGTSV